VEHVQQTKTQRERIHNDNVYFTSSRHPKDAPAWTYKEIHYETDDEEYVCVQGEAEYYEYYGEDDNEYFARIQEEGEEEDYDLLPPGSSFIRDSAEMNTIRPEDLDEPGEGSKVSLVVFITNFILY
jgi:cupin superfamily acireductone dioxygenase involved in methionine salvage